MLKGLDQLPVHLQFDRKWLKQARMGDLALVTSGLIKISSVDSEHLGESRTELLSLTI